MPAKPRHATRRGFTLTELLVVISIIAILVAMTSLAVVRALGHAKQTRIKVELDQLDMALKAYKQEYGAYPPCDMRVGRGRHPASPASSSTSRSDFRATTWHLWSRI